MPYVFDRLIVWMIDWLIDWLIVCLIVRMIDWLIVWMIDWLIVWMIDWLIDCLFGWLIDWLEWSQCLFLSWPVFFILSFQIPYNIRNSVLANIIVFAILILFNVSDKAGVENFLPYFIFWKLNSTIFSQKSDLKFNFQKNSYFFKI